MKLYLMQHALAYPSSEDPERPLNPEGISQAKATAKGIKRLGLSFELVIASPERRAHQTAALVAEAIRYPHSDILTTEAALPGKEPQELLDLLQREPSDSRVLLVGHLPHLEKLARQLLQGGELLIENAGLSCLSLDSSPKASLEFHLKAEHLKL